MNERIKELAGETLDHAMPQTWCSVSPDELDRILEKFAELIVRECITQCEEVATDSDTVVKSDFVTDAGRMLHRGMWGGAKNCSGRIKDHFGVKE